MCAWSLAYWHWIVLVFASVLILLANMSTSPTREELDDFGKACSRLWDLDEDRFVPGKDYEIDLQGGKRIFTRSDAASANLFKFVNKEKFFSTPTFKAFYALLDNYEKETGTAETVTDEERRENRTFVRELMKTKPIQYVQKYFVSKGVCGGSDRDFERLLHDTWFKLYRREVRNDSSGFEHVFVGESDEDQVKGFHNWVQFFLEERKGKLDYQGFVLPKKRGRGADDLVSTYENDRSLCEEISVVLLGLTE